MANQGCSERFVQPLLHHEDGQHARSQTAKVSQMRDPTRLIPLRKEKETLHLEQVVVFCDAPHSKRRFGDWHFHPCADYDLFYLPVVSAGELEPGYHALP